MLTKRSNPVEFIDIGLTITLIALGTLAITSGLLVLGVSAFTLAVLGIASYFKSRKARQTGKNGPKVPQLRSLVLFFSAATLSLGVLAAFAFRGAPPHYLGGTFLMLLMVACALAALFLASLYRTSSNAQVAVQGEDILAEGIGRSVGGRGVIVLATNQRVVAIPARLTGKPTIAVSIPYQAVENFKPNHDSLTIRSSSGCISVQKCPPNQIISLATILQRYVES